MCLSAVSSRRVWEHLPPESERLREQLHIQPVDTPPHPRLEDRTPAVRIEETDEREERAGGECHLHGQVANPHGKRLGALADDNFAFARVKLANAARVS